MNVGNSVRKAIDDWELHDLESAMLHACNAIDGTAKKAFPDLSVKQRFTRILRENYAILGPMSAPGINLHETRFPVFISHPTAPGGKPDLADVIYAFHRNTHAHGDELPDGFTLIPDTSSSLGLITRMKVEQGKIHLSDRIIFGLIAVAILTPNNKGQKVPDSYYITIGESGKLFINDWWGRAVDFLSIYCSDTIPLVKLDFGEMTS